MSRYYLAYASNLSKEQMRRRCPSAVPFAAATINGWRLGFFGKGNDRWGEGGTATLLEEPGATALGALYELTAEDEAKLDGFEGVAQGVYRKLEGFAERLECPDLTSDDIVYAYIKYDTSLPNPPSELYINTIRKGFKDWQLPGDPLDKN